MTSHASQGLRALQRVCKPFPFIKKGAGQVCAGPILPRPLMPLKASRPCFQIRNSHHKLPGPDKIVVQDWKHPVRAPSKETKGLEPPPNPNWHPSGLDKHRLKKTKGLEPPPNPNWHPSGLDKSSLQTQIQLFKIGSNQSWHRLKKTKGLEPPPNPNWHRSGLDKSSLQTQIHLFQIGSIQSGHRLKKTKGFEPPPHPNWHLWS